jgi:hypothetical protein
MATMKEVDEMARGRGRQTRRPRLRSLSRETRTKIAEGAEAVAEKADPGSKKQTQTAAPVERKPGGKP